jgi:hypothetical protein
MTSGGRVPGRWLVVGGLRRWAQGSATDEAAVELLIGLGARFTHRNCPWVRPCRRPGWFWLDPDRLRHIQGRLSDCERRVLALVVTLLDEPASTPSAVVPLGRVA